MAVGLVVDYMVHIVHFFLHQVSFFSPYRKHYLFYLRRAERLRVYGFCSLLCAFISTRRKHFVLDLSRGRRY